MRIASLAFVLALSAPGLSSLGGEAAAPPTDRPNIVFIMADDQGWGDLGCNGNASIKTPNIDRLAAEGMRFTDCYSGSAVCAPTRCALMTGLHTGHARRRDNEAKASKDDFEGRPLVPLEADDLTVAAVLKRAGYVTGGFGKWGLGNPGTTGTPDRHGFDHFFGYLDQVHAHDYYTDELWSDGRMVPVPGNQGEGRGETYSHDVIADAALDFIRRSADRPFFLYVPFTPPHGDHVVPTDEPYSGEPWSQLEKNYAAQITRMDGDVGRIMALLKELGLDEKTIVFYTSDNGPNPPFLERFRSAGPFRGVKRQLYEGGIRCPMIVRWPGKIVAGAVSDFAWSHVDVLATACDLAGVEPPKTDGVSVLPTLFGQTQAPHEFLYWEIYSPFHQAVRMGTWKGVRFGTKAPMELYDLATDPGETRDVAARHPDEVGRIAAIMDAQHVDSKYWPTVEERPAARPSKPAGARKGTPGKSKSGG